MANLGSLAESGVVALAVSEAAGAVVEPALEPARQEAEKATQARIHDLDQLAQSVAQALLGLEDVTDHAARNGYDKDELALSVQLALKAPGVPEALALYRRRDLDGIGDAAAQARLYHAFAKAQIEYQYWPQLLQTADLPLDPAVIALGIVRGLIKAPFELPAGPPQDVGKVPAFPVSAIDAKQEAEAAGIDLERLFVMVGNTGRPMPVLEAARATFRKIIEEPDFARAISEGDIRNEWGPFLLDVAREILTAHDHVELRLRGWYTTDQQMYDGTALHGMSTEDTDRLFKVLGRPLEHHQVFLAERRGGVYDGPTGDLSPAFLKSCQESNLRPEWYNLAWALRFSQPSVFVIRQWLKDGGDPAWAQTKLYFEGWEQDDIDKFVREYASTTTEGKKLTQAQIHAALRAGTMNPAEATAALIADGYGPATAQLLLNTWNVQATNNPAP
jgi:hypothetical protein